MTSPTSQQLPPIADSQPTIVHLCAEYFPYARTGGLAEAVWGLHREQDRLGFKTAAILPLYRSAREHIDRLEAVGEPWSLSFNGREETFRLYRDLAPRSGTPVWFIEHEWFFDRPGIYADAGVDYPDNHLRFSSFAAAAVSALPRITDGPVLLHAHDWHTALAPVYLRWWWRGDPWFEQIPVVLSVHNGGYQGHFGPEVIPQIGLPWDLFRFELMEWHGKTNFLKGGLTHAEMATTVSPTHAMELRTPDGGFGLHEVFQGMGDRFFGVLNGIDANLWDPARDAGIAAPYSRDNLEGKRACKAQLQRHFGLPENPFIPLVALAGRMVTQKGLDLVVDNPALFQSPAQYVFLGSGERRFEDAIQRLRHAMPQRVASESRFSDPLEHLLMAGADHFLMPSQYEPCGLTQMRAQRFGTIPIGRRVGGLADTIEDGVTGFLFDAFEPHAVVGALWRSFSEQRAAKSWREMQREAMARDFSWNSVVGAYLNIYARAIAHRAAIA